MMASLRSPAFQSLLRGRSAFVRCQQRRWAQVHDVRFLATHHESNHLVEKYKDKLERKAREEGHESIESLRDAYKDKIQDLRRKASTVATPDTSSPSSATYAAPNPTPQSAFTPPPPPSPQSQPTDPIAEATKSGGVKPLSAYLNVEKILDLPPKEIEALWRLRHANNPNSICACIPLETYQRIVSAARNNPQFILPLPRQQQSQQPTSEEGTPSQAQAPNGAATSGADIHFLQWAFHPPAASSATTNGRPASSPHTANTHTSTIIFTNLAAYKLHGTFAEPHTTVTHHLDLADEKGLVLMHGQVVPDRGVNTTEASWLVSCVQRFYDFGGQASGRKGELLRMFTRGDVEGFKIEELMEETEKV